METTDNTLALLMTIDAETPAEEVLRIMREVGPDIRRETVEQFPEAMARIWQIGEEMTASDLTDEEVAAKARAAMVNIGTLLRNPTTPIGDSEVGALAVAHEVLGRIFDDCGGNHLDMRPGDQLEVVKYDGGAVVFRNQRTDETYIASNPWRGDTYDDRDGRD